MTKHIPILLKEVIENLNIQMGGVYIDATLGGGGHTIALSSKLKAQSLKEKDQKSKNKKKGSKIQDLRSKIICIDQDQKAIEEFKKFLVQKNYKKFKENKYQNDYVDIVLKNTNFENLKTVLEEEDVTTINGVIADLGMSTDQLEDEERGFSFKKESKLDLRMGKEVGVTAADLLNGLFEKELIKLFKTFGDILESKKIAKEIVNYRSIKKIETTNDLLTIINKAVSSKGSRNLIARVFQALRIAVNHELTSLQSFLPQVLEALAPGCSACIITFHSGEDRIVKHFFKSLELKNLGKSELIYPTQEEIQLNPKSSSAKLRVYRKTDA